MTNTLDLLWQQFLDALEANGVTFEQLDGDAKWLKILDELKFSAFKSGQILKLIEERHKVYGHTKHTHTHQANTHTNTHTHTAHRTQTHKHTNTPH